jgi:hypothetical protein
VPGLKNSVEQSKHFKDSCDFWGPGLRILLTQNFQQERFGSDLMDVNNAIHPQSDAALDPSKIKAVQAALKEGILSEDHPLALFYNLSRFRSNRL